jgi:RNA polymerase sigma factor (sigma-70 family)
MPESHEPPRPRVSPGVHLPPFQSLVDAYGAELHRFLVASVGRDHADDCLQEAFVSALRAYPRLRHADNLRAWLYTIAHRKATDVIRGLSRRPSPVDLDAVGAAAEPRVEGPPTADEELWDTVRALPAKQRSAVVQRYVLDLDYRTIGERMGISEEAARQNVSTALRRLRQEVRHDR